MKPFREREISKIQGHIPNSKNFGLFNTEKNHEGGAWK